MPLMAMNYNFYGVTAVKANAILIFTPVKASIITAVIFGNL
jgi:hypothetical protein